MTDEIRLCFACGGRPGVHIHHKEHKAMGGRHGLAKIQSEARSNKVLLCYVCHSAAHLEHAIEADGFCCERCPVLSRCYWGQRTLGREVTVERTW